jgi:hypothetical protein
MDRIDRNEEEMMKAARRNEEWKAAWLSIPHSFFLLLPCFYPVYPVHLV